MGDDAQRWREATQRRIGSKWYAQPNDLIGGWCVMDVNMTPANASAAENMGDALHEVACFTTREEAEHIAGLHNEWVKSQGDPKGVCRVCDKEWARLKSGRIRQHLSQEYLPRSRFRKVCDGSYQYPKGVGDE